jgi:DNA invertase Pin-like site-specific DNA recombinase
MTDATSPTAYSYIRFSEKRQEEGDSIDRQETGAKKWADRNNVPLDRSLKIDRGISAFKGKNADLGSLGEFLRLVERGRVRPGDYLVVENLDRISRTQVQPALRLILGILAGGVRIVQLTPAEMVYDDKSDTVALIIMIVELSRAHGESALKSDRVGKARAKERERMRETGEVVTHRLPAWVEEVGGKPVLIPDRAAVVKRIFRLAGSGYGVSSIIALFEKEKVPAFGRTGRWTRAYIDVILTDRRALGELQPRKGNVPDGPPIPDYFPAAVTEDEYYAARAGAAQRRAEGSRRSHGPVSKAAAVRRAFEALGGPGTAPAQVVVWCKENCGVDVSYMSIWRERAKVLGKANPKPAPPIPRTVNLFAGLLVNARDGETYALGQRISKSPNGSARRFPILLNTSAKEGRARSFCIQYHPFEDAVLSKLREIDPREIINGDTGPDDVAVLSGEFARLEARAAALADDLAAGHSPTLAAAARKVDADLAGVAERLAAAKQKAAHPLAEVWGECRSLLDALKTAADPADARLRLRSALRGIVESITLLVIPRGLDRLVAVRIDFAGAGAGGDSRHPRHRDYLILSRSATRSREARWWARSLADVQALGPLDIRKRAHARQLAELLGKVDLESLCCDSPSGSDL